jgi:hypothetical protein
MIIIFGLVVLLAAVILGLTGVLTNSGDGHALTNEFTVYGYHVTGSTGTLFLYGIVVGAVGMLGLSLLLAGARRTSRRGRLARHDLKEARHETDIVSQDRDHLAEQQRGNVNADPDPTDRRDWRHPFGHRPDGTATTPGATP